MIDRIQAPRPYLPQITEANAYFWCGGRDGRLRILRCQSCGVWIHPFLGRCPECGSPELAPEPVSGQGTIAGCTVNHQPWIPGLAVPYVVAIVELDEQSDIRLMTNIPGAPIYSVTIGQRVQVYFEQHGDIFLPLFEPIEVA